MGREALPVKVRVAALAAVVGLAALTSDPEDWQPVELLVALGILMLLAESMTFTARRLYVSSSSVAHVAIMALLGPAPAVAIAVPVGVVETWLHRRPLSSGVSNLVAHTVVALVGGVLFEALRPALGVDRHDVAYAALVAPVYLLLMVLNLALVIALHPFPAGPRRPMFRESGMPMLPWEVLNAVMTSLAVLAWLEVGLVAIASLLVALPLSIALAQSLAGGLESGDDRDRLFEELLAAERRERGRLAEALHDGPVQRLAAMRLCLEGTELARQLDAAIEETRAIVTSLHPAMLSRVGFEACVRAAAAPFQTAGGFQLTVHSEIDAPEAANAVLSPVAQELVVNAAKHARPTTIAVTVAAEDGRIALEVSDDGVGIVEPSESTGGGHFGLAIIRHRVRDAGGTFEISARAGGGTRTRVLLPIGGPAGHRSEAVESHRESGRSTAADVELRSASSD
jgi:two-component system NarL family sensor kinase